MAQHRPLALPAAALLLIFRGTTAATCVDAKNTGFRTRRGYITCDQISNYAALACSGVKRSPLIQRICPVTCGTCKRACSDAPTTSYSGVHSSCKTWKGACRGSTAAKHYTIPFVCQKVCGGVAGNCAMGLFACGAGHYFNSTCGGAGQPTCGANACFSCPAGRYGAGKGTGPLSKECARCPAGSSSAPGAASAAACKPFEFRLERDFAGSSFWGGFELYSSRDPTNGYVNFTSDSAARQLGLVGVNPRGQAFARVDNATLFGDNDGECAVSASSIDWLSIDANYQKAALTYAARGLKRYSSRAAVAAYVAKYDAKKGCSSRRNSVRMRTNEWFDPKEPGRDDALIITADFAHVPEGCGVWPAFWLLGRQAKWPADGEIDIIEGTNKQTYAKSSLHTSAGCSMKSTPASMFSGSWGKNYCPSRVNNVCGTRGSGQASTDCAKNPVGCQLNAPAGSFGRALNAAGGGTWAMQWTKAPKGGVGSIQMWFWKRGQVPSDLAAGWPSRPDPSTGAPSDWGKPYAFFPLGKNGIAACSEDHFRKMSIVIDTTLCGDSAGANFKADCPSVASKVPGSLNLSPKKMCERYVRSTPGAFSEAYWAINHVRVYGLAPARLRLNVTWDRVGFGACSPRVQFSSPFTLAACQARCVGECHTISFDSKDGDCRLCQGGGFRTLKNTHFVLYKRTASHKARSGCADSKDIGFRNSRTKQMITCGKLYEFGAALACSGGKYSEHVKRLCPVTCGLCQQSCVDLSGQTAPTHPAVSRTCAGYAASLCGSGGNYTLLPFLCPALCRASAKNCVGYPKTDLDCAGAWVTGKCSALCGGGMSTSVFLVTRARRGKGKACAASNGDRRTNVVCNRQKCPPPPPGAAACVGKWTNVGACSSTCKGGLQTSMYLISKAAVSGGKKCPFPNGDRKQAPCNAQYGCSAADCRGKWGQLGKCSKVCEPGVRTQTYTVTKATDAGGQACPHADGETQTKSCDTSDWSGCKAVHCVGKLVLTAPCPPTRKGSTCNYEQQQVETFQITTQASVSPRKPGVQCGFKEGYTKKTFCVDTVFAGSRESDDCHHGYAAIEFTNAHLGLVIGFAIACGLACLQFWRKQLDIQRQIGMDHGPTTAAEIKAHTDALRNKKLAESDAFENLESTKRKRQMEKNNPGNPSPLAPPLSPASEFRLAGEQQNVEMVDLRPADGAVPRGGRLERGVARDIALPEVKSAAAVREELYRAKKDKAAMQMEKLEKTEGTPEIAKHHGYAIKEAPKTGIEATSRGTMGWLAQDQATEAQVDALGALDGINIDIGTDSDDDDDSESDSSEDSDDDDSDSDDSNYEPEAPVDIHAFLEGVGLLKYESDLRELGVDTVEDMLEVDDDDMRDLGMSDKEVQKMQIGAR